MILFLRESSGATSFVTKSNFTSIISSNSFSVVLYYAPWCSHSKTFLPVYEKASELLDFQLHKVDCIAEKDLYWQEKVESFPTIKIYTDGNSFVYSGDRDLDTFLQFARKVSKPSLIDIDLLHDDPFLFLKAHESPKIPSLFLYNPNDDPLLDKKLNFVCKKFDYVPCYKTKSPILSRYMNISLDSQGALVLSRHFKGEEGFYFATENDLTSVDSIFTWLQASAYPFLVEFLEENDDLMFSSRRRGFETHVILIMDSSLQGGLEFLHAFREAGIKYKGKCVFAHINTSSEDRYIDHILNDIGVSKSESPTALIIRSMKTKVQFFRLSPGTDINFESIDHWVTSLFSNSLQPSRVIELEGN